MNARPVEHQNTDSVDVTIRRRRQTRRLVVAAVSILVLANVVAALGNDAWTLKEAWPFLTFEVGTTVWVLWRFFNPKPVVGSSSRSIGDSTGFASWWDFGASFNAGTDSGFGCGGFDGGSGSGTDCGGGS